MFAVVVVVVYLLLILEFKSLPLSLTLFPSLNSLSTSVGLDNDRHLGARNGRPEGGCHTHLHIRDGRHEIELCQVLQRGQRVLQVNNNNKWTKSRSILTHRSIQFATHRYSPMMFPSIMEFPVDGVHLKADQSYVCNKKICSVVLDNLKRKSTGSYRCEISGDAPAFHVVHETANMTVAGRFG